MNFNGVINLMNQQQKAIKEIEDLLAHDEKQGAAHKIPKDDIEVLKTYVETMKIAATTATALAKFYEVKKPSAPDPKPVSAETEPQEEDDDDDSFLD